MPDQSKLADARSTVLEVLRLRTSLTERQIHAALLGRKVRLTSSELRQVLQSPAFVFGPDDRWSSAPTTPPADAPRGGSARDNAVELEVNQLCAALGATGDQLADLMKQLSSERLDVDWGRM